MPDGTDTKPASPLDHQTEETFEKQFVEEDVFLRVLQDAISAIEDAGIPYVVIGGIPSSVMGRPRWTEDAADIDFFVRLQDAHKTLDVLTGAGFTTREWEPHWLFKATRDKVVVDVIFRSTGEIYLDEEMLERSFVGDFKGVSVRLVAPEDLAVMKAIAHSEQTPRYWHDGLALLGKPDLDWEYVVRRARQHGAHRVLSLMVYAQSNDIAVPNGVIRRLFETVYGD